MKINIADIDLAQFKITEHILNGKLFYLVQPNLEGTVWTQKNKIFRSSVWSHDGNLVSASFPKFVNWGENPENFPIPNSLNNTNIVLKLDGSTAIVDIIENQLNVRTRGTINVENTENKEDFYFCLSKYPKIETWIRNNPNYSLLFEITTPNQKIVIDYGDTPEFWLIGAINKNDYSLMMQKQLDQLAFELQVPRPVYFKFKSIPELLEQIKQWINLEGCCLYFNKDQSILKIKSDDYLRKHAFKSQATFENTVELFFQFDMPVYQEFEKKLIELFDYECFTMVRGFISTICEAYHTEVVAIVAGMQRYVDKIKSLPSRKDQAFDIISSYGKETNRSSYVFNILDGKALTKEQLKKLLYQVTKKD